MLGSFTGRYDDRWGAIYKHLQLTHDHSDGFSLVASERNSQTYVFCCLDVSTDERLRKVVHSFWEYLRTDGKQYPDEIISLERV